MTLLDEARELIRKHLSENPNLSTASLARDSKLPFSTVRSITQGEVKKTSVENITALLQVFMEFKDILNLINKHKEEEKFWAGIVEICSERNSKSANLGAFDWQDPDQEIVALASSSNGISRERILTLYGSEHGGRRLQALLDAGILKEINNRIKQSEEYVCYSVEDSKEKAALQSARWHREHMDEGGFLYHITQNYSEADHERAKEITRKYILDITNLEKNSRGGEKVLMLSIVANLLDGAK
ncbi:MAG TPA: hypothetical protein VFO10_29255 [Oligoflexus sp.]|uniref:hypothetical protein n=1 Tax=Oligoflexus sp. TaxID=1971216 RepID=UPI002D7E5F23|nr:hypothetical protein [Oligoflexus sp.]HET9241390.1 hypothetical protein [Oligoflexus sp.]